MQKVKSKENWYWDAFLRFLHCDPCWLHYVDFQSGESYLSAKNTTFSQKPPMGYNLHWTESQNLTKNLCSKFSRPPFWIWNSTFSNNIFCLKRHICYGFVCENDLNNVRDDFFLHQFWVNFDPKHPKRHNNWVIRPRNPDKPMFKL